MYGTQSFEYTKPAIHQPSTTETASMETCLSLTRRVKKKKKLYKSLNMSDLLLFNRKISSKSLKQQSLALVRAEWI